MENRRGIFYLWLTGILVFRGRPLTSKITWFSPEDGADLGLHKPRFDISS